MIVEYKVGTQVYFKINILESNKVKWIYIFILNKKRCKKDNQIDHYKKII